MRAPVPDHVRKREQHVFVQFLSIADGEDRPRTSQGVSGLLHAACDVGSWCRSLLGEM